MQSLAVPKFSCLPESQRALYIRRWLWTATSVLYQGRRYDPRRNPDDFNFLFDRLMENRI